MPTQTTTTETLPAETTAPGVHAASAYASRLDVRDATTVLAAADLTVLTPDTPGTGIRLRPANSTTDAARIIVVPVVDGQEQFPPAHPQHNDRRATWTHLMAAAREALTAAGWEPRGETATGGSFLAHTPAVRMARAVLTAAGIPLLPTGASSGAGALVHPVDGDQYQVRIAVWAAGHRHKPSYPGDTSQEAEAWYALMRQALAAMDTSGWGRTGSAYDCVQYVVPDDTTRLPERPTPVLGCDPEEDATVHEIARLLRAEGFMPLSAFTGLDGPAWGFEVSSHPAASHLVMVTYDSRQLAPVSARYRSHQLPTVHAMLAAYEDTLTRHGMTCAAHDPDDNGTVLWVNRPTPRSARARIHLADTTGFAWLPELTDTYRLETRRTDDQPWQPQSTVTQKAMLAALEHGLRRGWTTADVDGRTIYVTLTDPLDEFARYSRYVPTDTP
ncbi:hypothetical protein ACWGQ5_54150 [Streptomyces sp. NPDC055722]